MTEDRDSEDEDWRLRLWEEIWKATQYDIDIRREVNKASIQNAEHPDIFARAVEGASDRFKELQERRFQEEQRLSTELLATSFISGMALLLVPEVVGTRLLDSNLLTLAILVLIILSIIFALRAAVGIARWALFDILRLRDGLGQ